jgi:hypothetical protein
VIISNAIPGAAVGDDVTIWVGCDKSPTTCLNKFDNIFNFRGFPDIPKEDDNPFGLNGW